VPTDLRRQSWPELLDPAQDRPAAHIDATVSQDASDAFSRSAQLQVVADGQQNDVAREAMAGTRLVDSVVAWRPHAPQAYTARPR
jgi:hypothetical protein